jgi:signal transduction histidine kinase
MGADPQVVTDTNLRGRWLLIAQAIWLVLVALTLAVFVASAPSRFAQRQTADIAVEVALMSAYSLIATLIFLRKSRNGMALFVSLFLVMFGATLYPSWDTLVESEPSWRLLVSLLRSLGPFSLLLFLYLFPDGRFVPVWTRIVVVAGVLLALSPLTLPDPFSFLLWIGLLGTGVVAQMYRYRRVSGPVQRQQTKWVVFGVTAMSLGLFGAALPGEFFPSLRQPGAQQALYEMVSGIIAVFSLLLLPLSIGMAILRYRLWDIDIIINRTLVYGTLIVIVTGLYIILVGMVGVLFQSVGNSFLMILATGLIAVLFQPLRDRLQRGVNRLMYGERDDPYAVLSRLSQRLAATLAPEAVLPTIVETVKESLNLPYAAIALKQGKAFAVAASFGTPVNDTLRLPLVYQNETVGQLILAPRAPGETFSPADRQLLDDLAREAGVAVHAVRLTTDLQHSRARLVTTREEERRRLRRDLHDGLGPTLASLAQRLDTARILVPRDPNAAVALLGDLTAQVKTTITDIRRLVYALRPPALDELGLVSALREHAAHYNESNGLSVSMEAPERLPPLPAAVEVAAYRIVLEALTNVARHAHARTCHIHLELREAQVLYLEVTDDGGGLPKDYHAGVGLTSMRERAMELGGECRIEPGPTHGMRVVAWLPLPPSEE